MLIISWEVRSKFNGKPIELCGEFRDLEHFNTVLMLNKNRGWNIVGDYKILKETK